VPFAVQAVTVPDGSVTASKLAAGSVTAEKLSLSQAELHLGSNEAITATASKGTTMITLPNLQAGTYLLYGIGAAYADGGADNDGTVVWEIHDGTTTWFYGPSFNISAAHGWPGAQSAGFAHVRTLTATTTLHLAAYKLEGLTNAVAGGGTRFGYIRIR
jgi:hypothetical protein